MPDWFKLRIKAPARDFDAVRAKIMGWPEEVAREVYWPQMEAIAQEAREYIRFIILQKETATGQARAAQGGNGPGRVKTGKMFDLVRARVRARKQGFSAFVGWLDGKPGYAVFQELGTKNGVEAMEAIHSAREYMLSQMKALQAGRYMGGPNVSREDFD